uniref:Uncharacterized protein n=1 Tax=Arundo donax TaxID=35708 RepID=A0A0A8Z7V9_ARUDO
MRICETESKLPVLNLNPDESRYYVDLSIFWLPFLAL